MRTSSGSELGDNAWLALREVVDDLDEKELVLAGAEWAEAHEADAGGAMGPLLTEDKVVDGLNGVALLLALEEAPLGESVDRVLSSLRVSLSIWMRGGVREKGFCTAVVVATGEGCTSKVHTEDVEAGVANTCRRHVS